MLVSKHHGETGSTPTLYGSWDSSVGIVTRLQVGHVEIHGLTSGRSNSIQQTVGPTQPPIQSIPGVSSLGLMQLRHKADHPLQPVLRFRVSGALPLGALYSGAAGFISQSADL
jgi:hypothetical protein